MMAGLQAGDIVVVTGAGSGIGRAIAQRLAADGARLRLWDVDMDAAEETARICGGETVAHQVDVSDDAAVASAAADAGQVYALVNNAGIFPRAALHEATPDLWRHVLNVNLIGAFNCCRALVPGMLSGGRGIILNMSSGLALQGAPRGAHYAASKAGLMGLTKSLARELAPVIRVNCLLPGLTETAQPLSEMSMDTFHALGGAVPLGRAGQAGDIAGVAAFMLGADASYMTGQSISVCGGDLMVP